MQLPNGGLPESSKPSFSSFQQWISGIMMPLDMNGKEGNDFVGHSSPQAARGGYFQTWGRIDEVPSGREVRSNDLVALLKIHRLKKPLNVKTGHDLWHWHSCLPLAGDSQMCRFAQPLVAHYGSVKECARYVEGIMPHKEWQERMSVRWWPTGRDTRVGQWRIPRPEEGGPRKQMVIPFGIDGQQWSSIIGVENGGPLCGAWVWRMGNIPYTGAFQWIRESSSCW